MMKAFPTSLALGVLFSAFPGGATPPEHPPIVVTPAPSAPPAPPAPESLLPKGTHVQIGFNPLLGMPLRYRLTDTKTSEDGKREVQMADMIVRFDRHGNGYRMEARTEFLHLPPKLAADPMIKLAERPVVFLVDRDGAVIGMEDEDAYWRSLDPFIDALVRDPKLGANGAALLRSTVARMRQMPLAQRVDLLARNVEPIVGNGVEMNVGESLDGASDEVTIPFPVPHPRVRRVTTMTLSEASPRRARVRLVTQFDTADMARLLREMSSLAPKGRAAEKVPQIVQEVTRDIERSTGLLLGLEETDRDASDPAGGPSRERTLRRIAAQR